MRSTQRPRALPVLLAPIVLLVLLVAPAIARAELYGVRLSYADDPARTVVVSWNSDDPTDNRVAYGTSPDSLLQAATATESHNLGDPLGWTFTAELEELVPATTYFYKVGNPGGSFHPGGEPFSFRTLPSNPCDPFRFVVIGDNRSDFDGIGPSALWPGILAEAVEEMPDMFLNTGDMVKNGGDPEEWRNFLLDSEVGLARVPSLLTMGNHDEDDVHGDDAIYNQLFGLPRNARTDLEDYYSLDAGPIHFVSLSTQFVSPGSQELADMLAWLDADLAANAQPWIVVFFHKAVYSKGNHSTGEESSGTINASFTPLFDQYDVDLVFNGHSHNYERYVPTVGVDESFGGVGRDFPAGDRAAFVDRTGPVPDGATGTTYVVTGGAGALTSTVGGFTCEDAACTYCTGINLNCDGAVFDADQEANIVYAGEHNFAVVDVDGGRLSVRAWATETGNSSGGFEIDAFEMVDPDFDPVLCGQVVGDEAPADAGSDAGDDTGTPDGGLGEDAAQSDASEDPAAEVSQEDATSPGRDVSRSDGSGPDETTGGDSPDDSCGCSAAGGSSPGWLLAVLGVLVVGRSRRRRGGRTQDSALARPAAQVLNPRD